MTSDPRVLVPAAPGFELVWCDERAEQFWVSPVIGWRIHPGEGWGDQIAVGVRGFSNDDRTALFEKETGRVMVCDGEEFESLEEWKEAVRAELKGEAAE